MLTKAQSYWLAAACLLKIDSQQFLFLLQQFPNIEALFQAEKDELLAAGATSILINVIQQLDWQLIEKELTWLQTAGHHLITFDDFNYPSLLKNISSPPLALFLLGNPAALQRQQIAIVGARHATPAGLKNAEIFAKHLSEAGFAITSGLALGTDGAAHRGALIAQGVTIGVCGTGLDQIYPPSHRQLYVDILANNGAIISEFKLGAGPLPYHFPHRNRIIAGMSLGVVVIEAAIKSGSLITARLALEQGREVFAVPGSIHNPLSRGCHHLIKQGATLVETADDILNELGALQAAMPPRQSQLELIPPQERSKINQNADEYPQLPPDHQALFDKIDYEITPFDVIHLRSRLTAGEVSSILLLLELQGLITSTTGGYQRIA